MSNIFECFVQLYFSADIVTFEEEKWCKFTFECNAHNGGSKHLKSNEWVTILKGQYQISFDFHTFEPECVIVRF